MSLTHSEIEESLTLIELSPTRRASVALLKTLLPDVETALFFAQAYELDAAHLRDLLSALFGTPLIETLIAGDHSTSLQDYLVEILTEEIVHNSGATFSDTVYTPAEVLPQLWESVMTGVAESVAEVAGKLGDTLAMLPGKAGQMVFKSLAVMNRQRQAIGQWTPMIEHPAQTQNLVILDVSGSMTENTIRTIVQDVVSLCWMANAHLATVSNSVFHWEPGSFTADGVLQSAAFSGTHYEHLKPLLDMDWGTVVTIADYDSSLSAKQHLSGATGHIGQVLDISLVNRPTFLAECVGQRADRIRPLLIGNSTRVL
jgi:hypothetical protein